MTNLKFSYMKAILVHIIFPRSEKLDENLEECLSLAVSANIKIIRVLLSKRRIIDSKYFIGSGKLSELNCKIKEYAVSVVLFNCFLSSSQERNLTDFLKCKIIDRNQLILNIFEQRALTYEGRLQVKLAQLQYLKSRLIHEWNHLERQKGGIGFRSGPGEMQLESDRRILSKRILQVLLDLKKIKNQREQSRCRRKKIGIVTISLVGYTNAGKSTLFNKLTFSNVKTSENLFVTLDPTFREISDFSRSKIMLIDTVGFIHNLPKDLINSFKATLEELNQSVLLLHVVDIANKRYRENIDTVNHILNDININNVPVLMVMNKIDKNIKIDPHIDRNDDGLPVRVWISAQQGLGIDLIKVAIDELLPKRMIRCVLRVPVNSDLCMLLYKLQAIEEYCVEERNTVKLKICLSFVSWKRLLKYHTLLLSNVIE